MRAKTLLSLLNNFEKLMTLWDLSLTTFDFLFGCTLAEYLLKRMDNLSKPLQHAAGYVIA